MVDVTPRLDRRGMRGVTLVELMIGLIVIAIGLTVAVPSFNDMIARNQVATQVNDFLLAINIARSEASRTGGTVSLQAIGSDEDNEFGEGYCVVTGNPGNCGGAIRTFSALGSTTLNSVEDVTSLQFTALGALADSAPRNFDLCPGDVSGRRIFVSPIGRSKSHSPTDPDASKQPDC